MILPSLYTLLKRKENQRFANKLTAMKNAVAPKTMVAVLELVEDIRRLKKEKNAVILSHYYMPAALQITVDEGGVADFVGDSLGLSLAANKVEADYIIFCGVKFMAETAHILNPDKRVLLPSMEAGCSLASSISGAQVRALKERYPGRPVIAYINTYAETKAECDICCTSRNALNIAESFYSQELIFLPDRFMGANLAGRFRQESGKELITWDGRCEVHEQFTDNIGDMQELYPEAEVLLHWEVPDNTVNSVLSRSRGLVGSTTDIINYVGRSAQRQFIVGSECDLGAALKGLYPDKEFITPCVVCRYMKKIQLKNTLEALQSIGTEKEAGYAIKLDAALREKARLPIERMIALS